MGLKTGIMGLKTGVPQIDDWAASGVSSMEITVFTLGLAALSLIYFFFRFLRTTDNFPVISGINSLASLDFKNGRAPESYHWTRLLRDASDQVSSYNTYATVSYLRTM